MSSRAKVVCGACSVAPEVVAYAYGGDKAVCPQCGRSDNANDAIRIAREHIAYEAAHYAQDSLPRPASRDKFPTFGTKPLPRRTFRWHAVEA
jgi:hypothetical protein